MEKDEFARQVMAAEHTLYRVAKTMLQNEADCEDAVSDAILRAFSKLATLRDERYFKTWLVRILINVCNKRLRENRPTVPYDDALDMRAAPEAEDHSELYRAIGALNPKIRSAVLLHYIEGCSVEEVSRILKIPRGTVKSRLAAGRKFLKERLTYEYEELS